MRLSDEVINDIRNSASITEVIGHYIPLIKKGKGYTALCPFHDDHDPSLSISEDKQIYKCFVCGNGGNVFSFVMNYKKCSFLEAVKEVADIIGKPLDIEIEQKPKIVSKYQRYYDLLQTMITYSNYLLTGSKVGVAAKEYLSKRNLNDELIEYFNIGYDPENNYICRYLSTQGYSDEEMIKVNVARMMDNGMSDVFYRRVLFPIHDSFGNPIAFTARDITGNSSSKYINSSDTLIYTKGDILYNYHRAKEAAKHLGYIIVCEGVMDVIAYYRAGYLNCVATLGTACTKKQLELLKSLSNNLVLSYDGDEPGQKANMKIGEMALEDGFTVHVVDNKTGMDPDEIVNQYSHTALRDLLSKKVFYLDYCLTYYKNHFNLGNYTDRKAVAVAFSKLIDKLKDEYDRENYANELYELTKLRKREGQPPINAVKKEYNSSAVSNNYSLDGLTKAEYTILTQMSLSLKASQLYQKELGYLLDEKSGELAMMIIDDYRKNGHCHLSRLYDETDDPAIRNLITNLATASFLKEEYEEEAFMAAIGKVKQEIKKRHLEELKQRIAQVQNVDEDKTKQYLTEYTQLIRELGGNNAKD